MKQDNIVTAYRSTLAGILAISSRDNVVTSIKFMSSDGIYDLTLISTVADVAAEQMDEYMIGQRKSFSFPISATGTVFQRKVWEKLSQISYGEVRSYGEVAASLGNPKAARAVGMACNRNPLPFVVPCHRVVGSNGSLTGYAGGLELKKRLLELEGIVLDTRGMKK